MRRVLLTGYYGFGNTGDEAILASTIKALREADPSLRICVLSQSPNDTEESYGVAAYHRMSPAAVLKAVRETDLVIFGGGSLLQDSTSFRSLVYYLSIISISLLNKKPVVIYANGIGPLRSRFGRLLVRLALSKVSRISVRDGESKRELRKMGVKREVAVTADPAFLLSPAPKDEVTGILEASGISAGDKVVWLALRNSKVPDWFNRSLAAAVLKLISQGYTPCFLIMQKGDEEAIRRLTGEFLKGSHAPLHVVSNLRPDEALGVLEKGAFCLGMRLHTLILAARARVPFIGVEIDPKIGAFCRTTGCPVLPNPASSEPYDVEAGLNELIAKKEELAARLAKDLPHYEKLALQNIEMVLSSLDNLDEPER